MMVRSCTTSGGVIRVHVVGEIDMETVDDVKSALFAALAADGASNVVVDFADVTFCDSAGIAALDRAYGEASQRGIDFRVTNVQPGVRRVLEITGMLDSLTE